MPVLLNEQRAIRSAEDVVGIRQAVRQRAVELGFNLIDQTKIVTAASELARNTVQYGGGGQLTIEGVEEGGRRGLRLTFEDRGPGIADIELALDLVFGPLFFRLLMGHAPITRGFVDQLLDAVIPARI